jgi:hypothetical protein
MSLRYALVFASLLTWGVAVHADCMKDRSGEVICGAGQCQRSSKGYAFCAYYKDGAAMKTRFGEIVCGKGQCVKTRDGDVVCSGIPGGSVLKDWKGEVRCAGYCELAAASMCVRTPASSW